MSEAGVVGPFLAELAEIGADPRGGITRLAFGPEERRAHRVFGAWAERLGLTVSSDAVGNTFAELPGRRSGGPGLLAGSHLDTVPMGGAFDGAAGVAAALEAGRQLAAGGGLELPFRVVVFSGEEGARFGAPCIGSRVAAGAFTAATLEELADRDGRSVAACAAEVGLRPEEAASARWEKGSVAAFLELHIEQGRVLESRHLDLGVVDAIAGSTRVEVGFVGRADHSGATPMALRRDALAAASELVLEAERRARGMRTAVATVGRMDVAPGSPTTIPGEARVVLDVRDVDSERQRDLAEELLDAAQRTASRRDLRVSATLLSDQSPAVLHKPVRECLVGAAREVGASLCVLASGASHDAAHVAAVAPAGMLFVPSRDGLSHSPGEWSSTEDIIRGANALAVALRTLDARAAAAGS
jgi:allantoate deiminase